MQTKMNNTDQVLNKALDFYGRREQEIKVCEELGELQQAVFKSLKGTPSKENLTEEIADVLITIEYIKKIHNIKYFAEKSENFTKIRKTGKSHISWQFLLEKVKFLSAPFFRISLKINYFI